jgi:Raf kinase inhibitor-like YbhB/YbcL family protein
MTKFMVVCSLWLLPFMCEGKMKVTSKAFENGGKIGLIYSCEGENISPALEWEKGPANTASYALICDDPDAPMGTWVHWIVYNIPVMMTGLPQGFGKMGLISLGQGIKQGQNSWNRMDYGGPCPPSGIHRYYFKIYALDIVLTFRTDEKVTKDVLLEKMKGHILSSGELMGKYEKRAEAAATVVTLEKKEGHGEPMEKYGKRAKK